MNIARHLLSLSKKQFFRAPQWEQKLAVKILIGFFAIYFFGGFLLLGIVLYPILKDASLDVAPIETINQIILFYFVLELLTRYLLQKLPTAQIQHFIVLPVRKSKIVSWIMVRSAFSFFNVVPFILFLPFTIFMGSEEGHSIGLWLWWVSIVLLTGTLNFGVFLINKSKKAFLTGIFILALIVLSERWAFLPSASTLFGNGMKSILQNPLWAVIPGAIWLLVMIVTKHFLKNQFYLDRGLRKKTEKVIGSKLSFLNTKGIMGTFLKNDIRLLIRNVRTRQVLLLSFLFLFYGLVFFTQESYLKMESMLFFAGLFTTAGFMLIFGQYVPAWDSEYYNLLMCQNIAYKKYLESKWLLCVVGTFVSLILSIPYLYFGWHIYQIIIAGAFFNMGIGSFVTLYSGVLNKTAIKLNVKSKAFENTQAYSLEQFILTIPKIGLPVLIFWLAKYFFGFQGAIYTLMLVGVLGLLLKEPLLKIVERAYQKRKYETLVAFNKKQS